MMKRFLLLIVLLVSMIGYAHAATALYRISSGEVLIISQEDSDFSQYAHVDLAVKTGATYPDGYTTALRVLGASKIIDGDIVRNATQEEINTFRPANENDILARQANRVIQYMNTDIVFRRILVALVKGIIREDNENRQWIRDFKAAVAASTSLADFQSRVAALDTPVDREFQAAKDYIISQVSKDD